VPSFDQLARTRTTLDPGEIAHLQRLVGSWALLSDLSHSDLLLYVEADREGAGFMALGHCRSVTGPTVHPHDPVGMIVESRRQPLMARAISDGRLVEGLIPSSGTPGDVVGDDEVVEEALEQPGLGGRLVGEYVPVRFGDRHIAVMARESDSTLTRQASPLERAYRNVWRRLAEMVMSGEFPFVTEEGAGEFREPRVGDGSVLLDRERHIEFVSPNAVSALHRLGVGQNPQGRTLRELGIDEAVVGRAFTTHHSTVAELVVGEDLNVVVRCHPLLSKGRVTGALLLTRDISELRSRDRLLLSREVTIREINHRVKNNLQTIQALLRLQARRAPSADARVAIEESARRIGAIAIVHETLSADAADEVEFDQVVAKVLGMVEEGSSGPESPLRVEVVGGLGTLAGNVAMPLAVVLTELVQNAIDHGGDGLGCVVSVELEASAQELRLRVVDRGSGVPDGFSLDRDAGLGLTIVRTFVVQDLGGTISIRSRGNERDRDSGSGPEGFATGCEVEVKIPRSGRSMPLG